jgi:hypothetical protein
MSVKGGGETMVNYIEYLSLPEKVGIAIVAFILVAQVIGEISELMGLVVPEIFKIRKYFARKKQERITLQQMPEALKNVQAFLNEVNQHYSADNITKRNDWIDNVNYKLETTDERMKEFDKKLDKNNENTLSILIDNKRDTIINFASYVMKESNPVTREQFNRIFKLYDEYEQIIEENGKTNGEVDIAHHIIKTSYETHMRNQSFVEDIYGYDFK